LISLPDPFRSFGEYRRCHHNKLPQYTITVKTNRQQFRNQSKKTSNKRMIHVFSARCIFAEGFLCEFGGVIGASGVIFPEMNE
jgi:hypothetical protein